MTLPTFLGIGVHRSGTSWLNRLLGSHPDIYVPARRKEIHFFDLYYDRGLDWYKEFFPPEEQANRYRAIGEITPNYFYVDACPERIARIPSIDRLILNVRNPVDRAYSSYGRRVRDQNQRQDFEEFLSQHPEVIGEGFYSQRFKRYLEFFAREQILVLVYEQAVGVNLPATKQAVASFLGVGAERFPVDAGERRIYESYVPRARSVYAFIFSVAERLRAVDQDWIVNLAKRLGVKRMFASPVSLPPMKEETRRQLERTYEAEIAEFGSLIGVDLECWNS